MNPEEQYLGAILLHPDIYWRHDVQAGDFTSPRCLSVFEAIGRTLDRGQTPEAAVLLHELPGIDVSWLASLSDDLVLNVDRVAGLVIDGGKRHKITLLVDEVRERVATEPVGTVLDMLEAGLTAITERRGQDIVAVRDVVKTTIDVFEKRFKARGELPGIHSGLIDLDGMTMGFEGSRLYVVGGRPSEGKSALLLNFAIRAAQDVPVGFVTIESSRTELLERWFANESGINGSQLRGGYFKSSDFKSLTDAAERIYDIKVYLADKPNMELGELKSTVRQMVRLNGAGIVFVDYLQLIQTGAKTDYERVSQASVALKELARELEIPIVAAAQLNRQTSGDPKLSDFKGSGQIEQDADVAILISRRNEDTYLSVSKNRDGATGEIQVWFDRERMRFRGHAYGRE